VSDYCLKHGISSDADGDIDENFWSQAAAERAEIDAGAEDEAGEQSHELTYIPRGYALTMLRRAGLPMAPFESQFFHDDVDDGADFAEVDDGLVALTDGDEAGGGEAEDLWAGTQGTLRKSKPEGVHYAKKAKRVDVKRLKDNIWKGLDMALEAGGESETEVSAANRLSWRMHRDQS
jgi:condensin complex subunit 2